MRNGIIFTLITAFCLLSASVMKAQNTCGNFSVTDTGNIIWQKIYDTEMSYDDIITTIINSGSFTDIVETDSAITLRLPRTAVDFKSMGYARGNVPLYVSGTDFSCFVTIQVKDGRYRVTVENIVLIEATSGGLFIEGHEDPLEMFAVKKGAFAKHFETAPSAIYDQFLSDKFSFKKKSYIDNEW